MDKFEKTSIYNVTLKIADDDGIEHDFVFKPLPWATFPDVFGVLTKLSDKGLLDDSGDLEGTEFLAKLDKDLIQDLLEAEMSMVSNSYPTLDDDKLKNFVSSNMFDLLGAMMDLTFKQQKKEPRRAKHELQAKG